MYFLKNDYKQAKTLYRSCIKQNPKPQLEANVLNNLACTAWYHQREQERLKTIPEQTVEKDQAKRDSTHVINYFKDSIEKLEKIHNEKHGVKRSGSELQKLDQLFSKESVIPNDFTQETEEEYFTLLKS